MHKIYSTTLVAMTTLALLLGNWRGHIALFITEDKETPLEVYPFRTDLLPVADQKMLANGISIGDPEELTRLLEDLLS